MSKQKYLKKKSDINYSYSTIKVTKSRIDKGLLAIPVSLVDKFPDNKKEIAIYFDSSETLLKKSFTPYNSSSRECRIGGMRDFFIQNNIENDDEIVIQFLDKKSFRIISENRFKKIINKAQQLILSTKEDDFKKSISIIKKITNEEKSTILKNEFLRLTNNEVEKRKKK